MPDTPLGDDRSASSISMLAVRVLAVRDAWLAQDEDAVRGELFALAAEAQLLARVTPLPGWQRRLAIAAEREGTARMG